MIIGAKDHRSNDIAALRSALTNPNHTALWLSVVPHDGNNYARGIVVERNQPHLRRPKVTSHEGNRDRRKDSIA